MAKTEQEWTAEAKTARDDAARLYAEERAAEIKFDALAAEYRKAGLTLNNMTPEQRARWDAALAARQEGVEKGREATKLVRDATIYDDMARNVRNAAVDSTPKPAPVVVKSGSGESVPQNTANGNGIGSSTSAIQTVAVPASGKALTGESIDAAKAASTANTKYQNSISNVNTMQSNGLVGTDVYEQAKQEAFDSAEEQRIANENLAAANGNSLDAISEIEDSSSDPEDPTGIETVGTEGELEANGATDEVQAEITVTAPVIPDPRIRIRAMTGQEDNIYGPADGVMSYLHETNGVFFPFTPNISYNHSVNYSQMVPTHANTDYWLYVNTPAVQMSISGQFSAQNLQEAQYLLASMHFFRTVTKMRFGDDDDMRGLPPPVLLLSGYGDFMFNDLHVIVTNFSMELANNVDYIEVDIGNSKAWVPTLTTFTVSLTVQQTPYQQRAEFNFDRFASGEMFSSGRGWI